MTSELTIAAQHDLLSQQDTKSFETLLGIVTDALRINPPLYVTSIMGPIPSWFRFHDGFSEFRVINLWRLRRTIKYLVNTLIPSIPRTPPRFGPPLLNNVFWHPTTILQRPDHNGSYTSFPDETWVLINGIMTNDSVAQLNSAYLSYLFHRPITMVQNSTDSIWIDLWECTVGKSYPMKRMTEPMVKAFPVIHAALKDKNKKKVVVIAHSQGTIIMANVLRWLKEICVPAEGAEVMALRMPIIKDALRSNYVAAEPETFYTPAAPVFVYPDDQELRLADFEPVTEDEFKKLEVYCFANCANTMTYLRPPGENGEAPLPWIENFGNEKDIVARLGMLAPDPERWGIAIDGPCYECEGAWGHLLNAHYLNPIEHHQKSGRAKGGRGGPDPYVLVNQEEFPANQTPRLFDYINGGLAED